MLQCGEVSGNNSTTWDILKNDKNHELAEKYQEMFSKVRYYFNYCVDGIFNGNKTNKSNIVKRLFCDFVERDFFTHFTEDMVNGNENCIANAFKRMSKEASDLISKNIQFSANIMNAVFAKKRFDNSMFKYATKEGLV